MMGILKIFALSALCLFCLTGCITKALTIGHEKSYCEEMGCENPNAGKCASPYSIIKERFGE